MLAELPPDVVDADSAVNARAVETWRAARDLGIRYARARAVQNYIVANAGKSADQPILARVYGNVMNPDAYVNVCEYVVESNTPQRASELTCEPIPKPTLPWAEDDPVASLRFVLRDDVEWWCPSMDELKAHRAEVDARNRPNESSPQTPAAIRDMWVEKGEWGPRERPMMLGGGAGSTMGA